MTEAAALAPPQPAPPQPAAAAPEPATTPTLADAGNAALAALFGRQPDGSFLIDLGPAPGVRIAADEMGLKRVDLATRARPLPGLVLESATLNPRDRRRPVSITGRLDVPHVAANAFTVHVSPEGRFALDARARLDLPALGSPDLAVTLGEDKALTASVEITPERLTPRGLGRNLALTGGGTVTLAGGKLTGTVHADLSYPKLGAGAFDLAFTDAGRLTGSGHIALTTAFLTGARADLAVDEAGALAAAVDIPAASIVPNIAGLSVTGGSVHLDYRNGVVTGAVNALALSYPGLGSATVSAEIDRRGLITGQGGFALGIAGFADATGDWAFRGGNFGGRITVTARQFPAGLPVRGGQITATLGPTGEAAFAGQVGVTLGPAGAGELRAAYDAATGATVIGATVNLTVPGLQGASFTITYIDGRLEGEGEVPVDIAHLPGVTGNVHVVYREGLWSGETELAYSADNGKLAGSIRVQVAQTEAGALQVSGGGDVTAQIAPRLQGTLHAEILPEGGVDVSGSITVTEPLELFPEWRMDKELFRLSKNIPLWAILVAVIRVGAGVRAGIGPGVFRNITVEGSYTIGQDGEPSFAISGEMFIPAFVEAYVSFGAGLGVDVVLGSLTGGIEGTASAGIYGAVSVIPQLSYQGGDYMIDGTATLAAGARLKLRLNAWAEIEALWVTVWDETWKLGEWIWNIGPDLGLQAHMAYNFSNPAPPTIEFTTSDIDTDSLIQAALPEDGPGPSGAREALANKAEWKGALKAPGPAANTVPADLAAQGAAPPPAPAAPARPPKPPRPAPPPQSAAPSAAEAAAAPATPAPGPLPSPAAAPVAAGPATSDPAAAQPAETHFTIGTEPHEIRAETVDGQIRLTMASNIVESFVTKVEGIRDEWLPFRRDHPAGNFAKELDALATDSIALVLRAHAATNPYQRSGILNKGIDGLAQRLRAICQRFDIRRIEGITNYKSPPKHDRKLGPLASYGRATGMRSTLSVKSRPYMHDTTSDLDIPGVTIAVALMGRKYQKGHLLAASLGGEDDKPANFSPMSKGTNTTRGGIVRFEAALRDALQSDVFPPWIVGYAVTPSRLGEPADLQARIDRRFAAEPGLGPQPGTAVKLFQLAQANAKLDLQAFADVFPDVPIDVLTRLWLAILKDLLETFTPASFGVNVEIDQSPEGAVLPASQPFANHQE